MCTIGFRSIVCISGLGFVLLSGNILDLDFFDLVKVILNHLFGELVLVDVCVLHFFYIINYFFNIIISIFSNLITYPSFYVS